MAGGMNILTNYSRHFGLGGKALTNTEVAELRRADAEQKQYEYSKMPLYGRIFNTENNNSSCQR